MGENKVALSLSDKYIDDLIKLKDIKRLMDRSTYIEVPEWACAATSVSTERLLLGLIWKVSQSKRNRKMGFSAQSKWVQDHYRLSKNSISRAYTSLKNKHYIQKAGDGSWVLNYIDIHNAAVGNGWKPK